MIQILKDAPLPYKGTEVHTLANGLTLILKEDHTTSIVAMQIWAQCGAVNETPDIYGISHCLEHMVFKGTPTHRAEDITRLIESNGGTMNAATQLETTHYYIDIPSAGTKTALGVLADTVNNPIFPEEELQQEKKVIIEEIARRDDNPSAVLWDDFFSNIFKGSPYSRKVIGSRETVTAMKRSDLIHYHANYYGPKNLSIVVVGDIKKSSLLPQLTKLFGNLKPRKPSDFPVVKINGSTPIHSRIEKPVQLTYLAMGIPTVGLFHNDVLKLDILADVIGGGISSRLFQKLREDLKIVLSISCDYIAFREKGIFSFSAETLPPMANHAIKTINEEMKSFLNHPIQSAELDRAKARIKSSWLFEGETPHGQATTLGAFNAVGRLDLVSTYISEVDKITVKSLMDTFENHIAHQQFHTTQVVPNP